MKMSSLEKSSLDQGLAMLQSSSGPSSENKTRSMGITRKRSRAAEMKSDLLANETSQTDVDQLNSRTNTEQNKTSIQVTALWGESETILIHVNVNCIDPSPYQCREVFDEQYIEEMASSITDHGVLQPLVIRKVNNDDRYELIAGECRLRGAKLAGLESVPCLLHTSCPDSMAAFICAAENINRKDVRLLEECKYFKILTEQQGLNFSKLSRILGISRTIVSRKVRFLEFHPRIKELIAEDKVNYSQASEILESGLSEDQKVLLAEKVAKGRLTIGATRELINKLRLEQKEEPEKDKNSVKPHWFSEFSQSVTNDEKIKGLGLKAQYNAKKDQATIQIPIDLNRLDDIDEAVRSMIEQIRKSRL